MRALFLAALIVLSAAPAAEGATLFYAVTESNRLVSFASDSPGNIRTSVPISGTLESENILALDVRPANGRLYGLGSANLLYEIDTGSGQARPAGTLFEVPIRGSSYGFDFDPAVDRIRVVSDSELNMRLNPDDGMVVDNNPSSPSIQPDMDLAYAAGDPGGAGANVSALAYAPGAAPRVFGIDTARDTLVRIDPPADGVLHTLGSLGVDAGDPNGFDIDAAGTGWAAFKAGQRPTQDLMRLDLAGGRAFRAGRFSAVGTYVRNRPDPIRALTVVGEVTNDEARPGLIFTSVKTPTVRGLLRGRPVVMLASCLEACRLTVRLRSGKRPVGRAVRFVRERAGVVRIRLRLTRAGRAYVRRRPAARLRLDVTARDAAGNVTTTRPRARKRPDS